MDEQTTTQGTAQETSTTQAQENQPATIEDQMAAIKQQVASLKTAVEGDEGDAGAGLAELQARIEAIAAELAAFKQAIHDAGIRLVS